MSFTAWLGIGFIVAILTTDTFLWIKKGVNATFSVELVKDSHKYPLLAFLVGFLIGHWFG